jgi:hypothetical protein
VRTSDAIERRLAELTAMLPQQGKVTAVAASTVTVDLGGTALVLPRLKSYSAPAVNDLVIVSTTSSGSKIVMGAIQP